ncbi:MAG: trypsin-like peptidase domain-containing protein [Deltaproteobacteria bacterium]|nr:trypsin-like peptidase domain-containing protein [Deltaproteobacteria bacterium]
MLQYNIYKLLLFLILLLLSIPSRLYSAEINMLSLSLKKVKPATWGVAIFRKEPGVVKAEFAGTGFFVSPIYFVTAAHVVNPELVKPQALAQRGPLDEVRIYWPNPDKQEDFLQSPIMQVVQVDEAGDIAVLKAPFSSKSFVSLRFNSINGGESVAIYGYAGATGVKNVVQAFGRANAGIVSMQTRKGSVELIETNIIANPGNSGGPLFLINTGEVVGIQIGNIYIGETGKLLKGYSMNVSIRALQDLLHRLGVLVKKK